MITVLVVDDEEPAVRELAYLLSRDERVGRVHTARSAEAAFRELQEHSIDLVLLDIHMPGLSGLETASILQRFATPPALVFVTADESHAIQAYELAAVDYLLKPVRPARLGEAVRRVAEAREAQGAAPAGGPAGTRAGGAPVPPRAPVPDDAGSAPGAPSPTAGLAPGEAGSPAAPGGVGGVGGQGGQGSPGAVSGVAGPGAVGGVGGQGAVGGLGEPAVVVAQGESSVRIPLREITHVTAAGDYARLHTARGSFLERTPLSALEARWGAAGFVRIHRSALVRVDAIEAVTRVDGVPVVKVAGVQLPVARRALSRVRASFGLNALASERR
ncbi:MAG: response regulator transcription factor [Arthrobacter sp.]|jgi:DNA-binding LytR/AlgR family response regulator|nr:response regulator transcription factor [Arthrobacter sp.]